MNIVNADPAKHYGHRITQVRNLGKFVIQIRGIALGPNTGDLQRRTPVPY